jgi:hypothetical protein
MRHVIQKQHLHVEYDGPETEAMALQWRLRRFCDDHLTPVMELALDDLVSDGEHLFLEKLEIDAGTVAVDTLEVDLSNSFKGALSRALKEELLTPRGSSRRRSTPQAMTDAFLYFLEQGTLPWWFRLPEGKELEQALLDSWLGKSGSDCLSGAAQEPALAVLMREPARRRLILQFSEQFLSLFLPMLSDTVARRAMAVLERLDNLSLPREIMCRIRETVWESAFAAAAHRATTTEQELVAGAWRELPPPVREQPEMIAELERHWPGATPQGGETAQLQRLETMQEREGSTPGDGQDAVVQVEKRTGPGSAKEGIYVDNGGLVLLHPYLPQLFERVDISEGPRLLLPERAVAVLHYLASGSLDQPEFRVTLPKVLCNIQVHAPIPRNIELTDREREECDALLHAVIQHWGALGNSSADGLRRSFLMRQAKLSLREDDDWLLQVESNSYDILLEQLPWSISMVKLPWMPKLLWVQWN